MGLHKRRVSSAHNSIVASRLELWAEQELVNRLWLYLCSASLKLHLDRLSLMEETQAQWDYILSDLNSLSYPRYELKVMQPCALKS